VSSVCSVAKSRWEGFTTKLKGNLDSVSLGSLFQTLVEQRATGVLTISRPSEPTAAPHAGAPLRAAAEPAKPSPRGPGKGPSTSVLAISRPQEQKVIAIALGEIAVVTDKRADRSRLGELLVARGRLTESQLAEAFKIQRESQQRSRLGELLIKRGLIKAEDILSCLKFQLEEEICDLFTWKGAQFEFDSDVSIEDACYDELGEFHVQRFSIEPQALIAEASRRTGEWKTIEARLPTPYLCFKLSAKGEELGPKANTSTQQLIKLVKEGRTVETIVKRSHTGRFNVCRGLIKMLDDGWIFPYPAQELPALAAEHRAHRRYSDALFIYRRLLEATAGDFERRELQSLINDTMQALHKAQETGEQAEGAEIISYKEAAARFRHRRAFRQIAGLLFLGLALIVATWELTQAYRPPPRLVEEYQQATKDAELAVKDHDYEKAGKILKAFYERIPNKDCQTAILVLKQMEEELPLQSKKYLEKLLSKVKALEEQGHLEEAEEQYRSLLKAYAGSPDAKPIEAALERIAASRKVREEARRLKELRASLDHAQELLMQKKYTSARDAFQKFIAAAEAGAPERQEAENGLAKIKDVEAEVEKAVKAAEALLSGHKGEQAIQKLAAAALIWPDLPLTAEAARRSQDLKARLEQANREFRDAEAVAKGGGLVEALDAFRRIERGWPEFELQSKVAEHVTELNNKIGVLEEQARHARQAFDTDQVKGRQLFALLLQEQPAFMAARRIAVPVHITSLPAGATVRIDDQVVPGLTPLDHFVTSGTAFSVRWEKPGYDALTRKFERLPLEDLFEVRGALDRQAFQVELKPGILAPPVVLEQNLYVLHGATLTVLDLQGKEQLWSLPEPLLDDTVTTHPNPDGVGPPQFVNERSWWWPRTAPEPSEPGRLLLPLRSREIVELDIRNHSVARKLISALPVEPVGRVYLERDTARTGKSLLAVGCADGKIRTFDLALPAAPLWEKPADPDNPPPKGALAAGLASLQSGSVLALSLSGRLTAFDLANGKETGHLDLQAPLAADNSLSCSPQEHLAALVLEKGGVIVVDAGKLERVWELPVARALDEASHATVAGEGIYVLTRDGLLRRFPRDKRTDKPPALWSRPLDGGAVAPPAVGQNVYVATQAGTLYALDPGDGHEKWKYKLKGTATHLLEHGNVLYVATKEGQLLILATE